MTGYLTPHELELSILVFLGLGTSALVGGWKLVPWLRDKASIGAFTIDLGEARDVDTFFQSRLAKFFFKRVLRLKRVRRVIRKPKWFIIYLIPYSVAWLAAFVTLFELMTSIGLRSPLTYQGLVYDLVFARSNGQPNGALITDYIAVVLVMWAVALKYRDGWFPNVFLGVSVGLFLVGWHEGIWVFFYYLGYGRYLDFGTLAPNVISDMTSVVMYAMFIVGFLKLVKAGRGNPHPKFATPPPKAFALPVVILFGYIAAWFFMPPLISPWYVHLPITTINNPQYGQTIYNETKYWSGFWVNLVEGLGWKIPAFFFGWAAVFPSSWVRAWDRVTGVFL